MSLLQSNESRPKSTRTELPYPADVPRPSSPTTARILDALPGVSVWLAFVLSVLFSIVRPQSMLLIAMLLAIYCAVRFSIAGIASLFGHIRIHHWQRIDWRGKYLSFPETDRFCDWEEVHHVVLIPNFNEPLNVLRQSLNQLAMWQYARQQMTVVLAMEAAEPRSARKAQALLAEFSEHFASIHFTIHPKGLKGETQCKSANLAWAGRSLRRFVCVPHDQVVITTMDADTHWHEQYFSALTYFFVTNSARHTTFWQAPIRYHGNVWQINPLVRLVNAYSSAFELAYLSAPWWLALPISSYSMSLQLLEASGYWDRNVIADEWHMYVKSYFATRATLSIQPIYLPFSAFATTGETIVLALKNRYKQTLRHAWGSKEIGYIIQCVVEHPSVPLNRSLGLLFRVTHDLLLSSAGWVVLTVGSVLPVMLYPELLNSITTEKWTIPAQLFFSISAGLMFLLGLVFWKIDVMVRPVRQKCLSGRERFWSALSLLVLPLLTMIFVTFPVIHAQTLLMIGTTIPFQVSRKL